MSASWEIVEYYGLRGLEELEVHWRRIYASMPMRTGFHAYEAHRCHVEFLVEAPDHFRCLALSDGTQIRAICPLEPKLDRLLYAPVPSWTVSGPPHAALQDVICAEDDARRALLPVVATHLRSTCGARPLLVVGPAPADSVLWAGLDALPRRCWAVTDTGPASVFDCRQSFDTLMAKLSKHFRRNLRSHRRKLDALSGVRFVTIKGADLRAEMQRFLSLEASGWKGESGSHMAILLRANQPSFFRSLACALDGRVCGDCAEINAIYVGDTCIASQFCLRTGAEYSIPKIAFNEEYRHFGPGQLLLQWTLERCCQDPTVERLNLLTDGPWQRDWRPDLVPMKKAYICLQPVPGLVLAPALAFRLGCGRNLVRRLRCRVVPRCTAERKASTRSSADSSGSALVASPTRPLQADVESRAES